MLRINQLKLPVGHSAEQLKKKIIKTLQIREGDLKQYSVRKRSIDARKKPELYYVYSIDLAVTDEARVVKHAKGRVQRVTERHYQIPEHEKGHMKLRPVVIGSGPAGLFCAYLLALEGCCPLIAERGAPVRERKADVERFWKTGVLDPSSNVQFGEGGAGTFLSLIHI